LKLKWREGALGINLVYTPAIDFMMDTQWSKRRRKRKILKQIVKKPFSHFFKIKIEKI
jgi:hypothetical protein